MKKKSVKRDVLHDPEGNDMIHKLGHKWLKICCNFEVPLKLRVTRSRTIPPWVSD